MPRAVRSRDLHAKSAADAKVFRALADPTRRRILQVLGAGEMRAGDVAARFDVSRPAVSRHLRILTQAGLLDVRKSGRERYYAIRPGPLREAAERVRELDAFWETGLKKLGEHLEQTDAGRPHPGPASRRAARDGDAARAAGGRAPSEKAGVDHAPTSPRSGRAGKPRTTEE